MNSKMVSEIADKVIGRVLSESSDAINELYSCHAHSVYKEECKSCKKTTDQINEMRKNYSGMRFDGSPPSRHGFDEDLKSLFTYRPGSIKYDKASYDRIVKEMYGSEDDIPEYVVECLNEACNEGSFLGMVRSREVWDDSRKCYVPKTLMENVESAYHPELHDMAREIADRTYDDIEESTNSMTLKAKFKKRYIMEEVINNLKNTASSFTRNP